MSVVHHYTVYGTEERALEIEERERQLREQTRSLYLRYGLEYVIWLGIGLSLMFWSFYTTDTRYAGLCFWGGIGAGEAGMSKASGPAGTRVPLRRDWTLPHRGPPLPAQPGSGRVMLKLGMQQEGIERDWAIKWERFENSVVYSILEPEWRASQAR